jgi:hypothetical protein
VITKGYNRGNLNPYRSMIGVGEDLIKLTIPSCLNGKAWVTPYASRCVGGVLDIGRWGKL